MDSRGSQTCSACLSKDRKTVDLNDVIKKQCFLRLIWEVSPGAGDIPVSLCWECDALVTRFTKFKIQAQKSFMTLQNHTKNESVLQSKVNTGLKISKQFNIDLLHLVPKENHTSTIICDIIKNETEINNSEIIKIENDVLTDVKEEYENIHDSDNFSEDDEKTLIELRSKKKKFNKVKKKSKKKEKKPQISEITEVEYYREIELTDQEIEEERRNLESKEEYVNAIFRCEKCISSFPNADDLHDHIKLKHELNSSRFKCVWCECTFGSLVAYNYHTSKHSRRYVCVVCTHKFTSKRSAVKHYEVMHMISPNMDYEDMSDNNVTEEHALESSTNDSKLLLKPDTSSVFPCEFCDKTFRWKTSLRKHLETHRIESGQKRRPYCEPCSLSFTTTSNLQKHVKTSSKHQIQLKLRKLNQGPNPPDISTPEKQQAKIDEIRCSVNSGRQWFPCSHCDRRFQWRGNLLRHLHSHTAKANGELVCEPCNRTFSSIATYKQHMKISRKHVSESEFKYMCSDCGKRFANKTRLKDHVNWEHLKNYVHKCSTCQKVFKSHTSLYLHKQVVHKKDSAEHLCDHCGKPFPNRAKLRCHIVSAHSMEAMYACAVCPARFSWHSCLSRHNRRVHKGATSKT